MNPSRDPRAVPRRRVAGRTTARSRASACTSCPTRSARSRSSRSRRRSATTATTSISVAELNRWLGEKAEEAGAYILTETVGAKLMVEDGDVSASARATRGATRRAARRATSSPAPTSPPRRPCWPRAAGATSPAPRCKGLDLAAKDPQVWALGVKEVWEVEQPLDKVIHTLGWPLRPQAKYKEFGGSWIYPMNREGETPRVSIGFVAGLDWADATPLPARHPPGVQAAPAGAQDPRGRQARRLGREGDPRGRLLGDARSCTRPAW